MSITSTAPARSNGNGHHANTNGHSANGTSTNGNGANGTTPLPNGHPAAQNPNRAPAPASGVVRELRALDAAERQQITPLQGPLGAGFSAEQIAALSAPLDRARICSREQGRGRVNYLQGWVLIEEANRIFGFDGWQRQTLSSRCVTEAKRLIGSKNEGRPQKEGWGVTYIARVRITVNAGAHGLMTREGTGAGHGIDVDLGLAHESASKEAEIDAMSPQARAAAAGPGDLWQSLWPDAVRQKPAAGERGSSAAAPSPATQPVVAQPQAAPDSPLDPPTIAPSRSTSGACCRPSWRPSPGPSALPPRCRNPPPPSPG